MSAGENSAESQRLKNVLAEVPPRVKVKKCVGGSSAGGKTLRNVLAEAPKGGEPTETTFASFRHLFKVPAAPVTTGGGYAHRSPPPVTCRLFEDHALNILTSNRIDIVSVRLFLSDNDLLTVPDIYSFW